MERTPGLSHATGSHLDVVADAASGIISKLNRTAIRGQRLKVKLA